MDSRTYYILLNTQFIFIDATVQNNVFLILVEFYRFIIARGMLISSVTSYWSYPTVINSCICYKSDIYYKNKDNAKEYKQSLEFVKTVTNLEC